MRFSLWTNLSQPWVDVVDVVHHAEGTGWDGVYVADHFMADAGGPYPADLPTFEATAALAALAGLTDRVRLASLVFGITYRHPAVLAKWAATTDHISDGRLLLGVGAGWQENEHEQYGIPLGPPGQRVDRFEEALLVLRGLLDEETTTVEGEHFTVRDAIAHPKPVQEKLPILIGASGPRMLGVVARHADEWNMWSLPPALAAKRAELDQACEVNDRDPATIATSTQALFVVLDSNDEAQTWIDMLKGRPCVAGTPERIAESVAAWQEAGVDELIVPDFTLGSGAQRAEALDKIIEQVAPAFR